MNKNYSNLHLSDDQDISMKANKSYNENELIVNIYEVDLTNTETLFTKIKETYLDHLVTRLKLKCDIDFDKDELVKALNYDCNEYNKGFSSRYLCDKWIDVNHMLPKDHEPVLIFSNLDSSTHIAYYDKNYECWFNIDVPNRYFNFSTVTYWQRLPNPPERFTKKED